jgi:glutathione synthase/RimK-type ligase-like ATP-grasp enzyme
MVLGPSKPKALILALTNWIGAPRLPRAFNRAGFHVSVWSFPGLLVTRSQACDEVLFVSESSSNDELLGSALQAIDRTGADVIVPTDDITILVLHAVYALARNASSSARTLAALERSLGKPEQLVTARSRKLLAQLAERLNVRAPAFAVVRGEADARSFAAEHGFPVVLKQEDTVAGMGVTISETESELIANVAKYGENAACLREGVLAQTFVTGRTAMRCVVAQAGRVLGGISAVKLETWPTAQGPSTCVEVMSHAEMSATSEAVIGALGYSGFASLDFMLDADGGASLIELNPRPTPIAHLGERFGDCLCRHLYGALTRQTYAPVPTRELPSKVALFPQEWVRDPSSLHLRNGVYHDVPWDEPDLVEAYVAMGRGQMRFSAYRALGVRRDGLQERLAELEGRLARAGLDVV